MSIHSIRAIDVHAHFGTYVRGDSEMRDRFSSAAPEALVQRAGKTNIELTIVSPMTALMPRLHGDAVKGNSESAQVVGTVEGLRYWVVVNPLAPPSYEQATEMLGNPKCVGIKIHPEEHGYKIGEHGRKLFEFASEQRAVMLTHSGEQNSLPADYVQLANDFPDVTLILAHLGCGWDDDPSHQVRAVQATKRGNVYVDTSSAQNILPHLIEWAVAEIGSDRLLFGTDSPCYYAPMQRARIDYAEIPDADKRRILRDNALQVLGLQLP